jgi:hypothetical protein
MRSSGYGDSIISEAAASPNQSASGTVDCGRRDPSRQTTRATGSTHNWHPQTFVPSTSGQTRAAANHTPAGQHFSEQITADSSSHTLSGVDAYGQDSRYSDTNISVEDKEAYQAAQSRYPRLFTEQVEDSVTAALEIGCNIQQILKAIVVQGQRTTGVIFNCRHCSVHNIYLCVEEIVGACMMDQELQQVRPYVSIGALLSEYTCHQRKFSVANRLSNTKHLYAQSETFNEGRSPQTGADAAGSIRAPNVQTFGSDNLGTGTSAEVVLPDPKTALLRRDESLICLKRQLRDIGYSTVDARFAVDDKLCGNLRSALIL